MVRQKGAASSRRDSARDAPADTTLVRADDAPQRGARDELAYLGDMIGEMSAMAARLGSPTLAGILELARREAELELTRRD